MSSDLRGQVGLRQHSTGWIGKLIEWCTDSNSHHVVVFLDDYRCMSAEYPHARIRWNDHYPSLIVSRFDLTDEQRKCIVTAALAMNRRPYNVPVLFVHLARKFGIQAPQWFTDWLKTRPALDCSDLADRALTAGGIDLFSQDPTLVTPADFEHYYRTQGWLSHERANIQQALQ